MPYKNIHWIKIKLEIMNDKRFLFDLDDGQKLLFLGLLMLAGATNNYVPDDENFLKNRLNLSESTQNIRKNLSKILSIFPKTVSRNGFLKFKNFNRLHNYIRECPGSALGVPKEALDKNRIDKNRIDRLLTTFSTLKTYPRDSWMPQDQARNTNAAKRILQRSPKDEEVENGLLWLAEDAKKNGYNWTLETLDKKWLDYQASKVKVSYE